jgi:hypothetical protein
MPCSARRMGLAEGSWFPTRKDLLRVRVSHEFTAVFDDSNLVSCAGLTPVLTLAEPAGLHELLEQRLTLTGPGTAKAAVKVTALIGGMVAGADCIDDMDLLRHGATDRLFNGVRARRRWGRSCARSPSGMSGSWTRSPLGCWLGSPRAPRCWRVPRRSRMSMWTTRSSGPTATPSRAPGMATAV